jgi:hypothetical protein
MPQLPPAHEQIVLAHANLIHAVVRTVQNPGLRAELDQALKVSEDNGWVELVAAIRKILAGDRSPALFQGLDEEDAAIVEAILRGLQDPTTLPDPEKLGDASLAAPGLAAMIHAAGKGDVQALQLVAHMAEEMTRVGGDMGRLGGLMRRLVNGERDAETLCKGMGAEGEQLVVSILEELGKLEAH